MRLAGFIGPSYTSRSVNIDSQRSVNMYPEADEIGSGKDGEVACLQPTPGLRFIATVGVGPGRGGRVASNGRVFVISGSELYESAGDTAVKRGDLQTASGPVSMDDNGLQLIIVDGPKGYIFTFADNTFVQITDPDFPGGTKVFFLDGSFYVNEPNTQMWLRSDVYDGLSWNGLEFGSAESVPDNVVSMVADKEEAVLIGTESAEFWKNDSEGNFVRLPGAVINQGIEAADTLQQFDNTVIWLGRDQNGHRIVWRVQGYTAIRASTHALENAIQGYGDVTTATSFTYQMNGHTFYVLNFEGANTTWVYDAATQMWHERNYTNAAGQKERHRANYHIFVGSRHLVGDYQNGNIYELTDEAATDNGAAKVWERTTSHTSQDGKFIYFKSLEIFSAWPKSMFADLGEDYDPRIMLSWSDDGAHTWSDEISLSVGKLGEYLKPVKFNRLGRSQDRVWKLRGTFPLTLISASMDAAAGTS